MGKIRKNYLCVFIFLIVSQRATNINDGFSYGNEDIRISLFYKHKQVRFRIHLNKYDVCADPYACVLCVAFHMHPTLMPSDKNYQR